MMIERAPNHQKSITGQKRRTNQGLAAASPHFLHPVKRHESLHENEEVILRPNTSTGLELRKFEWGSHPDLVLSNPPTHSGSNGVDFDWAKCHYLG